jgi:hypothetical protein
MKLRMTGRHVVRMRNATVWSEKLKERRIGKCKDNIETLVLYWKTSVGGCGLDSSGSG